MKIGVLPVLGFLLSFFFFSKNVVRANRRLKNIRVPKFWHTPSRYALRENVFAVVSVQRISLFD